MSSQPIDAQRHLLFRREAAAMLGVSMRTLDQWIADGKIQPTRLGRLVKIHRNEVDRIVREGVR